jgi:hypothetical protein
VLTQYPMVVSMRKQPAKLKALCNARTGVWYGLTLLDKKMIDSIGVGKDTTVEGLFGEDMFKVGFDNKQDDSATDSTMLTLECGGPPLAIIPFDSALLGSIELTLLPSGFFRILKSKGIFRKDTAEVIETIGSRVFNYPDTVAFLKTQGMPEGSGFIDGRIAFITPSIDSSDSTQKKRFTVDRKELTAILNDHKPPKLSDSGLIQNPLLIKDNDELEKIPDTIYSPLFIDGTMHDIVWKTNRTIYVLEQIQITGTVTIENIIFVAGKDIKILDKTKMHNVELYTTEKIFLAGETVFGGKALACGAVEIYDNCSVEEKSVILSVGKETNNAGSNPPGGLQVDPNGAITLFSVFVRDQAKVDGVIIALDNLAGIKIEKDAVVQGIVWAESRVCVAGRVRGIVKAFVLVDENEPIAVVRNIINGSIKELPSISDYFMPYFFGNSSIISWKEE